MSGDVEQIEDVVEHAHLPLAALLQPRKARLCTRERDHLAVHHELTRIVPQRLRQLREAVVQAEMVARPQAHSRGRLHADAADAVQLALIDPVRIGEAVAGQHRLHRLDSHGDRPRSHARPLVGGQGCKDIPQISSRLRQGLPPSSRCAPTAAGC
jgi:hypothetical protein